MSLLQALLRSPELIQAFEATGQHLTMGKRLVGTQANKITSVRDAFLKEHGATKQQLAEALTEATGLPADHPVIQRFAGKGGRQVIPDAARMDQYRKAETQLDSALQSGGVEREITGNPFTSNEAAADIRSGQKAVDKTAPKAGRILRGQATRELKAEGMIKPHEKFGKPKRAEGFEGTALDDAEQAALAKAQGNEVMDSKGYDTPALGGAKDEEALRMAALGEGGDLEALLGRAPRTASPTQGGIAEGSWSPQPLPAKGKDIDALLRELAPGADKPRTVPPTPREGNASQVSGVPARPRGIKPDVGDVEGEWVPGAFQEEIGGGRKPYRGTPEGDPGIAGPRPVLERGPGDRDAPGQMRIGDEGDYLRPNLRGIEYKPEGPMRLSPDAQIPLYPPAPKVFGLTPLDPRDPGIRMKRAFAEPLDPRRAPVDTRVSAIQAAEKAQGAEAYAQKVLAAFQQEGIDPSAVQRAVQRAASTGKDDFLLRQLLGLQPLSDSTIGGQLSR